MENLSCGVTGLQLDNKTMGISSGEQIPVYGLWGGQAVGWRCRRHCGATSLKAPWVLGLVAGTLLSSVISASFSLSYKFAQNKTELQTEQRAKTIKKRAK